MEREAGAVPHRGARRRAGVDLPHDPILVRRVALLASKNSDAGIHCGAQSQRHGDPAPLSQPPQFQGQKRDDDHRRDFEVIEVDELHRRDE